MTTETKLILPLQPIEPARSANFIQKLEERFHGTAWTLQEMMRGYLADVGELGRLVMAKEGRWLHDGDLPKELNAKLADCLWWVLVLADRMGTAMAATVTAKMNELDAHLPLSVARGQRRTGVPPVEQ